MTIKEWTTARLLELAELNPNRVFTAELEVRLNENGEVTSDGLNKVTFTVEVVAPYV